MLVSVLDVSCVVCSVACAVVNTVSQRVPNVSHSPGWRDQGASSKDSAGAR